MEESINSVVSFFTRRVAVLVLGRKSFIVLNCVISCRSSSLVPFNVYSSVQYPFCQENRTSIIVQILIYECMHSISAWHKSKAAHPVCHSFWKLTPVINIHTFLCKMKQLNLSIDGLICYANEREKSLFVCAKLSDFASFFFFFLFFLVKSTMRSSPSISSDESQVDKAIESGSSGNWSMEWCLYQQILIFGSLHVF